MKLLTVLALITLTANCETKKMQAESTLKIPACIQAFINNNKSAWQVGSVEEYEFQGKRVYAFTPSRNIKDGTTLIKSEECKDMCNIGGFAGPKNSNCNGDNFFEKAVFKRKIWEADKE